MERHKFTWHITWFRVLHFKSQLQDTLCGVYLITHSNDLGLTELFHESSARKWMKRDPTRSPEITWVAYYIGFGIGEFACPWFMLQTHTQVVRLPVYNYMLLNKPLPSCTARNICCFITENTCCSNQKCSQLLKCWKVWKSWVLNLCVFLCVLFHVWHSVCPDAEAQRAFSSILVVHPMFDWASVKPYSAGRMGCNDHILKQQPSSINGLMEILNIMITVAELAHHSHQVL